jgi:hypothetical protein
MLTDTDDWLTQEIARAINSIRTEFNLLKIKARNWQPAEYPGGWYEDPR